MRRRRRKKKKQRGVKRGKVVRKTDRPMSPSLPRV